MQVRTIHGRKGQGTEFYEWQFKMPAIIVQRVGEQWLLGVNHTDKRWQIPCYYPTLVTAKNAASRLVQVFLAATPCTDDDYWRLAQEFVADDVTVSIHIVDTTGRD